MLVIKVHLGVLWLGVSLLQGSPLVLFFRLISQKFELTFVTNAVYPNKQLLKKKKS